MDSLLLETPLWSGIKTGWDEKKETAYIYLGVLDKPNIPPSPNDVAYLGDGDFPVRMIAKPNAMFHNFKTGDHIQLDYSGTAADGRAVSWGAAYTAKTDTDIRTLYVPSAKLNALVGQKASLQFFVRSAGEGSKIRASTVLVFEVRGLSLPSLELVEAVDDVLNPDKISEKAELDYVTVKLDYPDMAVGDTVKLIREGVDANNKQINFVDKDRPISASNLKRRPMTITWLDSDIRPLINGVMTIYYKVYRGGVWYASPKRIISIGPSLASLPPFINEVKDARLDPDKIADSINLHIPSVGTIVGDKVTVFWSDTSRQTFTDEGVVTQQNVDGDMSFDIYLDSPISLNRGKQVTVFYVLERTLPGGKKASFRSGDYKFFVGSQKDKDTADARALTVPSITEVVDGVVDPALVGSGANLVVPFAETQVGDSVTAYWQEVGGKTPVSLGTQAVDAGNVSADLSFAIPSEATKAGLNKKVITYYVITRTGLDGQSRDFRSSPLSFSVGPLAPSALLPAPRILSLEDGTLDPMKVAEGAVVVVAPYPTIAVGDKVRVFWMGMDGLGAPDIPVQTVSDVTKPLRFTVPASAIGANIGAEVWVYYQVTRTGVASAIDSDDTVFDVELLGHDDLPAPVVVEAVGGTLDLGAVAGNITVSIAKWPFIAPGQRVWLRVEGVAEDGSAVRTPVWAARVLTPEDVKNGPKITIERDKIAFFKTGSELIVFASLTHDGDFSDEFAEAFPVISVLIKQVEEGGAAGEGSSAGGGTGGGSAGGSAAGQVIIATPSKVSLGAAYPKSGSSATPPKGSSQQLVISRGKGPYTYKSLNVSVAEVDANGLVKARGNGTTYIQVTDAEGRVIYVEVSVVGIVELVGINFNTYTESKKKADLLGLIIPSVAMWQKLRADGGGKLDIQLISGKTPQVWCSDAGSRPFSRKVMIVATGVIVDVDDFGFKGGTAHGFGMKL